MAVLNTALYPIAAASLAIDPDFGVVHDFSDDGVMHSRQLFGAEYFTVDARWDLLDAAKRAALETFLITYRLELITFDLDGHTYTTRMTSGPSRRYVSGHLYALSATFRGTRVPWSQVSEIQAMFTRLNANGIWLDPSDPARVWANTVATTPAAIDGAVARIDALGTMAAPHWQDVAANRPLRRADGLEFDGVNDSLSAGDIAALRFGTQSFTIAIALNPDTVTGTFRLWCKRGSGAVGTTPGWSIVQTNAVVSIQLDSPGQATGPLYAVTGNVLAIGSWSRLILEIDRGANQARAYVNDVLQAATAKDISAVGDISGTQPLTLGKAANAATQFFDGKLGRCLVIDRLLSDTNRQIVQDWLVAGTA